jgi:hypothetical protein
MAIMTFIFLNDLLSSLLFYSVSGNANSMGRLIMIYVVAGWWWQTRGARAVAYGGMRMRLLVCPQIWRGIRATCPRLCNRCLDSPAINQRTAEVWRGKFAIWRRGPNILYTTYLVHTLSSRNLPMLKGAYKYSKYSKHLHSRLSRP